jgi:glycosyltransferase involved in cell wall biosynthesis
MRPSVSVTILTYNEEKNLRRAIESVRWAEEILVVDSGSTDGTTRLAQELGAQVIHNPWPGYGAQKNFAQSKVRHDWVLNLDADEDVPPELATEIQEAITTADSRQLRAFRFPRKTYYLGRWVRHGGWYPNRLVRLSHRAHSRWTEPEVHERLLVHGAVGDLRAALNHYSFPTIESQVQTNLRFARLGSEDLRRKDRKPSFLKLLLKPWWKFVDTYFLRLGILDGARGFIISVNASYSMFLKYAYALESRLNDQGGPLPAREYKDEK